MVRKKNELSYPEPMIEEQNAYYAELLMEDYAGVGGELTAINQYMYQYITLKAQDGEIAGLAKRIAIDEMHHFALLGETIQLLGCNPSIHYVHCNQTVFWNASYVYYGIDIVDKLTADIAAEVAAIGNYQRHKNMIDDRYIDVLLERIIHDEQEHVRMFEQARKAVACKYY